MKHIFIANPAAGPTNAVPHIRKEVALLADRFDCEVYETLNKGDAIQKIREWCDAHPGERVRFYAGRIGVYPKNITLREQKTKWGSCSSLGNLNFNWKLIMAPPEALDYVVVHELAHLKEMNHSPAFYKVVASVLPDYKERRKLLKK